MKTLSRLKLNQRNGGGLGERPNYGLGWGVKCGCGCNYVDAQGSSIGENYNANVSNGYTESGGGNVACGDGVPATKPTH